MEGITDLLFNQKTLDVLMDKQLINEGTSVIPWGEGFALVDQFGKIMSYINVNSNNQLVFRNTNLVTEATISSVSPNQYQIYGQNEMLGTLFTYPESDYSGLDSFFEATSTDAMDVLEVQDVLSHVADLDVDFVDSILDISDITDLI